MQFQTPTVASLMTVALNAAKMRPQLLVLLALLTGIVTSIVLGPSMEVFDALGQAMGKSDDAAEVETAISAVLRDGMSTLLFGHIAATALSAFLLIPWARACAPGGLMPSEGGWQALSVRGARSFVHLLAANGITALIAVFMLKLAEYGGAVGSFIAFAGIFVVIWSAVALTGTAHLAIAAEARDRRETLVSAYMRAKFFMAPIAGSLALLYLVMLLLDLTVGGFLMALVPASLQTIVSSVSGGAFMYAGAALHIAALYSVPDFRDLRPTDLS